MTDTAVNHAVQAVLRWKLLEIANSFLKIEARLRAGGANAQADGVLSCIVALRGHAAEMIEPGVDLATIALPSFTSNTPSFEAVRDAIQTIRLGAITLAQHDLARLWIGHEGGESGTFPASEVEAVLREYFRTHF